MLFEPVLRTYATVPFGSSRILVGVTSVVEVWLISDRFPLSRSIAYEPIWASPWLKKYKTPAGRDDELPQLIRKALRPITATSRKSPEIFFDICSPSARSAGIPSPCYSKTLAFG